MALIIGKNKINYQYVFTESFLYYYILSKYLTLNDIKNLSYISKYTLMNAVNIDFRIRRSKKIYANIIINFLKRANNTLKRLTYDLYGYTFSNLDDFPNVTNRYLKRLFCIYMAKGDRHYKSWYIGINGYDGPGWKNDILRKYNRRIIDEPSRYDYFKLIKQMPMDEIYDIGW